MDGTGVKHYNKLVRDKIPEMVVNDHKECAFKRAEGSELLDYIEKKIQEELEEFKENPSIEEAADILEILNKYFLETINIDMSDDSITLAMENKSLEKGFFNNNFILLEVNDV